MITYESSISTFVLSTDSISYIMKVTNGRLHNVYFGKKISANDFSVLRNVIKRDFSPNPYNKDKFYSLDTQLNEYSGFGSGDYRTPAITLEYDGGILTDFLYKSHKILDAKPKIKGLPTLRGSETLVITLFDKTSKLELELYYTVYDEGGIAKSVKATNCGKTQVRIDKLASGGLDLKESNFELLELTGRYASERMIKKVKSGDGIYSISSLRGTSSHQRNPFLALIENGTTEEYGKAIGFNLIYSGNFLIECETEQSGGMRVLAGLHPYTTDFVLNSGESIESPELLIVWSDTGIGGMSRAFHDIYRKHLIRQDFANTHRPIVINNWESTYFDFNEDKICEIIKSSSGMGIDMFVLDDGWFGNRNNDETALGDWQVNKTKLKNGLHKIVSCCKENNLAFGLWFEPEMVSENSDFFRKHPEYCLHTKDYPHTLGRNQLVLNFGLSEVVDAVYCQIKSVLKEYPYISYIKWDMNRHLTCVPKKDLYHKYVLGVYDLYERLYNDFPNIMIEGCSGGGGRFDAGMLYYSPQIWTSDNTDAYSRTFIQYGTSICYPLSSISNHISVSPNHQTERVSDMKTRADIAMLGTFGYELDIRSLNESDKNQIKMQTQKYREIQDLVLSGDLYRLVNPFESENFCFLLASKNKNRAFVVYHQAHYFANKKREFLHLKGLNPDFNYHIKELNKTFSGSVLMNFGIEIPIVKGDYKTITYTLIKE